MRTIRTELKNGCTVVVCYDHITIIDSRKTVLLSLPKCAFHAPVWKESLIAHSHCTVRMEYYNHLLEFVIITKPNGECIAELSF